MTIGASCFVSYCCSANTISSNISSSSRKRYAYINACAHTCTHTHIHTHPSIIDTYIITGRHRQTDRQTSQTFCNQNCTIRVFLYFFFTGLPDSIVARTILMRELVPWLSILFSFLLYLRYKVRVYKLFLFSFGFISGNNSINYIMSRLLMKYVLFKFAQSNLIL